MSHKYFKPGKYPSVYLSKDFTGSFGIVELFTQ